MWKRISTKTIFQHPRITIVEDLVELPDGTTTQYARFDPDPDYPTVIAQNSEGDFAMVREYAYPTDSILLQFPEGLSDTDEAIELAASRELREETGLVAGKVTVIGYNLNHHRRSVAKNYVVVATSLTTTSKEGGDKEEAGIELVWLSKEEIWAAIKNGEIVQKNTLAAWATYQSHKRS